MQAFCTYCSANKDQSGDLMPASKRYLSNRIAYVQDAAERANVHCFILSGKFGLVDQSQPIPWYDHLLVAEEIPMLAALVTQQLREQGITVLDYFTGIPTLDRRLVPYLKVMVLACEAVGVDLRVRLLKEPGVSSGA